MSARRPVFPIDVHYRPSIAAARLAADVAHVRLSRVPERPMRLGIHHRQRIPYRPVHWHELPRFVRDIARRRGFDVTDPVRPWGAPRAECYCACHVTGPRSPSCRDCEGRHP